MTSNPSTDQQLVRLGLEILYSVFKPMAAEAIEGFFIDPQAYEAAPTQMES